jgi:tetratricopeptide (TPR) repeat protein
MLVSSLAVLIIIAVFAWPKLFKHDDLERLRSSGTRIVVAVMPFQNMTNDTTLDMWKEGIQDGLITSLSNVKELKIKQKESINSFLQTKRLTEFASLSPSAAGAVLRKLDADIFIYGSIKKAGPLLRVDAQIIDTKTNDILKSFELNRPFNAEIFFDVTDSLRKKITDFLLISNLIKENPGYERYPLYTNSYEAFKYYIYGNNSFGKGDWPTAREWFLKALAVDSSYLLPVNGLSMAYGNQGLGEQSLYWLLKLYKKRDQMSPILQLWTDLAYASSFEPPEVSIGYLRQILQIDEQPSVYHMLGVTYCRNKEFDKAIPELEKCLDLSGKWGKEFLEYNFAFPALGEAYHFTGRYKDEIKLYKKAEQANNDQTSIYFSWIIRDQATLSLTLGETVAANRYIKKFISVLKKNSTSEAEIAYGLASMYWPANKLDIAEEYYRKALSMEPDNPNRMNTLANRLIDRNKNFDEAYELLDKAMALAANKSDYYGYMDSKGMGLYKQGKYQEALEVLQKMYDSAPYKLYYMKSHLEEVKKAVAAQK